MNVEISVVKPQVWNFSVLGGKDAWKEVVYSARMSGVPEVVKDEPVFSMMVESDYGSALEHVICKFDIKMSKGNAPEFLEHRIASHSGYSTRYIEASEGVDKTEAAYEVILPLHLAGDEKLKSLLQEGVGKAVEEYRELQAEGGSREYSRYALPFAQAVGTYHVSMNLRSLLNFLGLRLCVRASPELRCIAAQLYVALKKELPIIDGLVGCRGYLRGACPESKVTGVRIGKQHPRYPVCPFKTSDTSHYIPTIDELRAGVSVKPFDKEKALDVRERLYETWARWE